MISNFYFDQVDEIIGLNNDKELEFLIDEVTSFELSNGEETNKITGKKGRTISIEKRNKTATGSVTNGIISAGILAASSGTSLEEGAYDVPVFEELVVTTNTVTISDKAVGVAGTEIEFLYEKLPEGNVGKKFTQVTGTPKTGEFKYDSSTKKITLFAGDLSDGAKVVVKYNKNQEKVTRFSNSSDKFSKTLYVQVFGSIIDLCDNQYKAVVTMPRCAIEGNTSFSIGGDDKSFSFNFEALAGSGCSGTTDFYDVVIF